MLVEAIPIKDCVVVMCLARQVNLGHVPPPHCGLYDACSMMVFLYKREREGEREGGRDGERGRETKRHREKERDGERERPICCCLNNTQRLLYESLHYSTLAHHSSG